MATQNFVVHNGLTVGALTIDAATSNVSLPVTKQLAIGNVILRDNGDGKLHIRDITDNSDAELVGTVGAVSTTSGNIQIGTNHIESTNADGPISLRPNGTGTLVFAANLISAGKGASTFEIATGLPMPTEYGVTYANANILLSPGRVGLYGGNVRVTQTTAASSATTGAFQVMGGMGIVGAAWFGSNVTIQGNLFVNGNVTTFNANNLNIADSLIYLADDNPADLLDIGIISSFTSGAGYQHTGLARDATDGIWKLFAGVSTEPTTTIDFTGATYSTLQVGNITTSSSGWANIGSINAVGNISGKAGILSSLTVNGATTQAGTLTVSSGFINSSGNILSTGAIHNSLTVNGATTTQGVVPATSNTYSVGSTTAWYSSFWGAAVNAQYADLAEKYSADAEYEPGTVLMFGGDAEVTQCEHDMSTAVAGVVSTNPAYLMNHQIEGNNIVDLALTGRVPCKVTGSVTKGDMMVSAGGGRARAEANPRVGSVIGKALQDSEGDAVIEVVVGKH